jgi:hypothetical protein
MLWGLWISIALTVLITAILLIVLALVVQGLRQSGTIR